MKTEKITAIRLEQPGGTLYLFKVSAKKLLKASYISRRSEESKGIQRILKKSRLNKIKKFIESENALFPNSIIVTIDDLEFEPLENESDFGFIKFPIEPNSIFLIDGQHRLHGFEDERTDKDFDVIVVAFEDAELKKSAYVFYKVNHEAKSVNTSLGLDLFGLIGPEEDFEKYQLHAIIKSLNEEKNSVFYEMINMTDVRESGRPFTQANLSTKIRWFLKTPEGEIFKNEEEIEKKPLMILLKTYFKIIKENQDEAWNDEESSLLRTNLVLGSLIYLLPKVLRTTQMRYKGKVTEKGLKNTLELFSEIDFSKEGEFKGLQGESGMNEISKRISTQLGLGNVEETFDL